MKHSKEQMPNLSFLKLSRRSFLKGALAAGTMLALTGCNQPTSGQTTATQAEATTAPANTPVQVPEKLLPSMNTINTLSYIIPDYTRCTSCRKCMFVCSMKHYGTPDLYKSNIQVYTLDVNGGIVDIPILCMKCTDNPCLAACPEKVQAITRDAVTGALLVDNSKCTACGLCIDACKEQRTGCLRLAKDNSGVVGMCDLCDGNPECVLVCPEDALVISGTLRIDGRHWAQGPKEIAKIAADLIYSV